jgi:hypothetical protein
VLQVIAKPLDQLAHAAILARAARRREKRKRVIVQAVRRARGLLVAGWLAGAAIGCRERAAPVPPTTTAPAGTAGTVGTVGTVGKERAMPDEVNIVELDGDAATLQAARRTPGVVIEDHGQQALDGGRFRVAARATDDGLAKLRAAGFTVRVVQSAAELRRHFEEMDRKRDGGS